MRRQKGEADCSAFCYFRFFLNVVNVSGLLRRAEVYIFSHLSFFSGFRYFIETLQVNAQYIDILFVKIKCLDTKLLETYT